MTFSYWYALGGQHRVAGQEIQENQVQNEPTVVHIATKTAPFVTQEISDKRMTKELNTLLRDLKRKEEKSWLIGMH